MLAAVLGGLLALSSLAGAQSATPANQGAHLVIVPATPEGDAALERSDVRTVARYRSFTLAEAAGADEAALRRAGGYRRDDLSRVSLPGGRFDPMARPSLARKGSGAPDEALVLVQFAGPVRESWLAGLRRTGARIVQHVPQSGYLVHARKDEVDRVAALVGAGGAVRAAVRVGAADKLAVEGGGAVAVQTVAGDAGERAREAVRDAAAEELRAGSLVAGIRTQFVRLDAAEVAAVAADPGVVGIGRYAEPRLLDERAAQVVAGNIAGDAPSGTGYLPWLQGKGFPTSGVLGFTIDVTDSGLDTGSESPTHSDFRREGAAAGLSRVDYATNYTFADANARDCAGHGTNVASIAGGFGLTGANRQDRSGFRHGMGVAPRVELGASKIFACDGKFELAGSFTALTGAAYLDGARVSNNSWGTSDFGRYSADSAEYDALVRDARPGVGGNEQMVEVFSAGNDGDDNPAPGDEGYASVSSPGTAKNVITVGASESPRSIGGGDGCGVDDSEADDPDDLINFSSRGPTNDGRLKPDLVAPGTHVVGASPQHSGYTGSGGGFGVCQKQFPFGNTLYSLVSGTSQAAPHVAGAAALVRDWYQREQGSPPSPALTKAILTGTATDIVGGDTGKGGTIGSRPNHDEGWGRVNLGAVLDGTVRRYYDQVDLLGASGESVTRTFAVQDAAKPVEVTLAWTDAPALADTDAWRNDLDLVLVAGGRRYRGNAFAGGWSRAGGATDFRNNLESVRLPPGTAGRFGVEVVAASIGSNGVPGVGDATDQDFALVVSNAAEQAAPVLSEESTVIDDRPPAGDNDSVLESAEQADLATTLRNSGTAAATGVSATLTGSAGLSVTPPGSSAFADVAAGANEQAGQDFEAAYAPTAPCGADAAATLSIATDQGNETIPIVLPTGEVGPTLTSTASGSAVPKTIPDENPVGVSSSVAVPERGRIKDLDVRITDLDHTWIGDLVITLAGPDGTTVRLAEHPGGPDNSANDFTNVVFDDSAGGTIPAGMSPVSGSFRPQNDQLSRFDGKSRRGTWTLTVRDLFEGDTGVLRAWGIASRKAVCDLDTTAPTMTLDVFPGSPVNQTTATFGFTTSDADAAFECRLDSAHYAPCTSLKAYSGLGEGLHTFRVQAVDGSGNESPEQVHTWKVDLTPPETTVGSGPSVFMSSQTAAFSFSASEPVARIECELDGGGFSPCVSPVSYSGLAEGRHTFKVRATDLAGNVDPTPAVRTWTVDRTAPSPTVTAPATATQDRTPVLRGTGQRGNGDIPSVTLEIFAGAGVSGPLLQTHTASLDSAGNWTVQAGALSLGQYTARVTQLDQAGNPGRREHRFTVVDDTVPPTIRLTAPASGSTTADATPALAGEAGLAEGDEGTVTVKLFSGPLADGLPDQTLVAPVNPASGAFSVAPATALAEGGWTAVAEQLDSAGNTGSSAPATFSIALPRAPSVITAPAEQDLRAAIAGRLTAAAACARACTVAARLSLPARTARRLGIATGDTRSSAGPVRVGGGRAMLAAGEARRLRVRLSGAARRALGRQRTAALTLRMSLIEAGAEAVLARTLTLSRTGLLRRATRRGLATWAGCSEPCTLSGALNISRREARRLGLRGRGHRMEIARGAASGGSTGARLLLRVPRALRSRLTRARSVSARLDLAARDGSGAEGRLAAPVSLTR